MGARDVVLIILGMSFSFAVILGLLGVFSDASSRGASSSRGRGDSFLPVLEAPPKESRQTASATHLSRGREDDGRGARFEAPVSLIAEPDDIRSFPPFATAEGRIDSLKLALSSPSEHLDIVQDDLKRQIAILKRSRDLMLDELAEELRAMPPERAAAQIATLDDESAGLALSRLQPAQRKAVLRAIGSKRARVLDRKLRTLASK